MAAILIQRCANGFLCSAANATDTSGVMAFPLAVTTDATAAAGFIAWVAAATAAPPPPAPITAEELQAVKQELVVDEPPPALP
jgi:hypothetical protein